jgi:Dehydrogenases with different specificities (related to short-chain alcohol dehydrogenases)
MAAYAEKGIKAQGYVCDVTYEPAVQAMVATIEKELGTIDILVNNARYYPSCSYARNGSCRFPSRYSTST